MREILFRGKDEFGWIYGDLVHEGNEIGIKTSEGIFTVAPETVGQYTGLKDKNGNKIFEGDIVKFFGLVGKVCFESGCFGIARMETIDYDHIEDCINGDSYVFSPSFLYCDNFISFFELQWNCSEGVDDCCEVCEVIGNIIDNPELLEE